MAEAALAETQLTLLPEAAAKNGVEDAELDKLRLAIREQADTIAALKASEERSRSDAQTAQRQVLQQADITIRSQEAQVDTALAAIDGELATIEGQIADALGRGDNKTVASLTIKASGLQSKRTTYEGHKHQIEGQKKQAETRAVARTDGSTYTDAAGTVHDLSNYHPETQKWIRSNPKFLTDPVFQAKVIRADAKAYGGGLERNTPEYFEAVETDVGLRQAAAPAGSGQEQEVVTEQAPKPAQARSTSTAAPVSRSTTGTPAGGPVKKIDLTADEAEAARISDPETFRKDPGACYQAYIKNREDLKAAGRLH